MNNLPAVDGMYPVVVGGSGLASLAVPESPRTGVYYASLGGTVVIRNVNPATVVSQLETAAASWLTSMGLAMDDPATAEMAINMVQPEAIAVAIPLPILTTTMLSDGNTHYVVLNNVTAEADQPEGYYPIGVIDNNVLQVARKHTPTELWWATANGESVIGAYAQNLGQFEIDMKANLASWMQGLGIEFGEITWTPDMSTMPTVDCKAL